MKSVLKLSAIEAREFFLKEESYFNFDLPTYFVFEPILKKVAAHFSGKVLKDFILSSPKQHEGVNYKFLNNKDGRFAWRPFQLIHPVLYVSLVHSITEKKAWEFILNRIQSFQANPNINCLSFPLISGNELSDKATSVSNWWNEIEQRSLELALEYEYVLHADIADCYGSIYTHSIAWALHSKAKAKEKRFDSTLIGNSIDTHLQEMSFGQTNGIPQGSVLMDFIAELVLGYADSELNEKIKDFKDFHILRYRDDYRIFSNNPQLAETILKYITEILIELGMRINPQKLVVSNNVIQDSIKADKLYWLANKQDYKSLQQTLLSIYHLSLKFPNSGIISKLLTEFFDSIFPLQTIQENIKVLISITVNIAYKNPRTYPITSAILSKLLNLITGFERSDILKRITKKFSNLPNTGHLEIWLQRITLPINPAIEYSEKLCNTVTNPYLVIWNNEWLTGYMKDLVDYEEIVNETVILDLNEVIQKEEVRLFDEKSGYLIFRGRI